MSCQSEQGRANGHQLCRRYVGLSLLIERRCSVRWPLPPCLDLQALGKSRSPYDMSVPGFLMIIQVFKALKLHRTDVEAGKEQVRKLPRVPAPCFVSV